MPEFTDPVYLKSEQYRDATNLDARIELHRRFSTNPYGWFPWIFDTLETLPAPARVLELGCGPAHMWKECVDRIPAGWHITLSDLSDGMLDAAWRNLVVTGRAFKFESIDAQSIPYPDETFDLVIANHMLYHVQDRQKALGEIRRVLRSPDPRAGEPGGILVATTVGDGHLAEIGHWFKQFNPDADFARVVNPFTLDNGLAQLEPYFSRVELKRYEDNLRVTELEPLLAYLDSTFTMKDISPSTRANLHWELLNILTEKGVIMISKDSGLFLAVK